MGRQKGYSHTLETRQKMSARKKGKPFSEEHKRKLAEAHKRYWQTHSLSKEERERRAKLISEAQIKRHQKNTVVIRPRKKLSEETKRRMSEGQKKRFKEHPLTPEQRLKLGQAISNGWRKKSLKVLKTKDQAKIPATEEDFKKVKLKKVDIETIREYVAKYGKIELF